MDLMRNQWLQAFGVTLRHYRAKKGISQERLAHEAGIDRTHMNVLEAGHSNPSLNTVRRICAALDISIEEWAVEMGKHIKKHR